MPVSPLLQISHTSGALRSPAICRIESRTGSGWPGELFGLTELNEGAGGL